MKSVDTKTALAYGQDNKPLLMLDRGILGIRYIMQLVAVTNTIITTAGSIALPTELWDMILGFALVNTKNSFCLVQGISLRKSSIGNILHCRRMKFNYSCSDLNSAEEVRTFEEFINNPNQPACLPFTMPPLRPSRSDENTFDILITSAEIGRAHV